jgi:hypothetical protein
MRLRESGDKRHATLSHHNFREYLVAYLAGAGLPGNVAVNIDAPILT